MNARNSVMSAPWRVLLVVIAALLVLAASPGLRAAAAPTPIDLASVILTPDELAAAGIAGLGFDAGRSLQARDLADRAVWPAGDGPERDAVTAKLADAGFVQGYAARATTFRDPAGGAAMTDVEWEVAAYRDAAGANTGFALVPDTYSTGRQTPEAGTRMFGDESRITRVDARDPQSGFATAELALGMRTRAITAFVLLRTPVEAPATVAQIERLADLLLAKIDAAVAAGASGVSALALRVEPVDELTVRSDAYLRYAGRDARSAFESEADFAARTAGYGSALDVFRLQTELPAAGGDYALEYASALYRFADEDDASAWLAQEPDRFRANPAASDVVSDPGIADLGDESFGATLTTTPSDYPIRWAIVAVRVGNVVAEIQLWRVYQAPSLDDALALARQQTTCLRAGDCPAPASVSANP